MKECPIECIAVSVERDPATKERRITQFDIDASKCMVCGLCVEACPTGGLRHTTQFAAADGDVRNLVLRYIEKGSPVAPHAPKGPAPEVRPKGSIVSAKIKNSFSVRPAGKVSGEAMTYAIMFYALCALILVSSAAVALSCEHHLFRVLAPLCLHRRRPDLCDALRGLPGRRATACSTSAASWSSSCLPSC